MYLYGTFISHVAVVPSIWLNIKSAPRQIDAVGRGRVEWPRDTRRDTKTYLSIGGESKRTANADEGNDQSGGRGQGVQQQVARLVS